MDFEIDNCWNLDREKGNQKNFTQDYCWNLDKKKENQQNFAQDYYQNPFQKKIKDITKSLWEKNKKIMVEMALF